MTYLNLKSVDVVFSIYQAPARSLKRMLLRTAVGGGIGQDTDGGSVVIKALQQIDLDIREGDRVALVGHNGAGKTTLLRVMAGIYQPTQGAITCSGFRVPLFDLHSGFDDEATGYENIVLRGLLMGFTRSEIEDRFKSIAEFSGLGEYLDLPVRTYSAGMALRLAFSISTSSAADIMLMDEWLATGDGNFVEKANARLHDLVAQSRILILASHDPSLLRKVCNRAVLMNSGRVEMIGSVDEVLDTYTGTRLTQ